MSWGNKLMIVFFAFGTMMGYLVYRCVGTPVELVSKDYYKDELEYQAVINGKARAGELKGTFQVWYQDDQIFLCLPSEMKGQTVSGSIWFYCASNSQKDKKIRLKTDVSGCQQIPSNLLKEGTYEVKLRWAINGNEYFSEQQLVIH